MKDEFPPWENVVLSGVQGTSETKTIRSAREGVPRLMARKGSVFWQVDDHS